MNCDDVFDALTDPALSQSAALDAHLAHCPRCRQLQQVLEPARSLLCGELPAELPGLDESADEASYSKTPSPALSVEAVGMAETIAAQLTANSGKSRPPRRPFARRAFVVGALRSAAFVLFGMLAVYCLGARNGDSDLHALPAVVPGTAKACTRLDLQKKDQPPQDARRVILSCVDCHMNDGPQRRQPTSTSLFWPPRHATLSIRLARAEMRAWASVDNRQPMAESPIS
ncbi:MAG TPA: hypothetical protein VHX68_03975 [Planctomycetaceae bacterium]|jgi:hypothetical protein|nr:hypothetical protein [Planctomycetaceae bacterium]